jgi:hypothetical protein
MITHAGQYDSADWIGDCFVSTQESKYVGRIRPTSCEVRKMKVKALVLAILLVAAASTAQAGLLTLSTNPQGPYTTPANGGGTAGNQIIPLTAGYLGADLWLTGVVGDTYLITYEFIGNESGYNNTFTGTSGLFTSNTTAVGTTFTNLVTATVNPQVLVFSFTSPIGTVNNGTNPDNVAGPTGTNGNPNFFISFNRIGGTTGGLVTGDWAYVAFDDGGALQDDNHDDLVVRVSAQRVPDPGSSLLLLGLGLVGLRMWKRR